MFSLRNELLQNSAFLRHNRCIELGKRYVALQLSARVKQLSPGILYFMEFPTISHVKSAFPQPYNETYICSVSRMVNAQNGTVSDRDRNRLGCSLQYTRSIKS